MQVQLYKRINKLVSNITKDIIESNKSIYSVSKYVDLGLMTGSQSVPKYGPMMKLANFQRNTKRTKRKTPRAVEVWIYD